MLALHFHLWLNSGMATTLNTYQKAVHKAARLCKGPSRLARACGVTPQAVAKWLKNKVPGERCLAVEMATHGRVTRYELRPDIFGVEPDLPSHQDDRSTGAAGG